MHTDLYSRGTWGQVITQGTELKTANKDCPENLFRAKTNMLNIQIRFQICS